MAEKLKSCPFCGTKAALDKKVIGRGSTTRKTIPEGTVLAETIQRTDWKGRPTFRKNWIRYGYTVRCNTADCMASEGRAFYPTEEEAITAWNCRKGERS